jgi:hypothetical protein
MVSRIGKSVTEAPEAFKKKIVVYLLASRMCASECEDADMELRNMDLDELETFIDSDPFAAQCPRMELLRMRLELAQQDPRILSATTIIPADSGGCPLLEQDSVTAAARANRVDLVIACRMGRKASKGVSFLERRLCHRVREYGAETILIPKGLGIVEVRRVIEGHIRSFLGLPLSKKQVLRH